MFCLKWIIFLHWSQSVLLVSVPNKLSKIDGLVSIEIDSFRIRSDQFPHWPSSIDGIPMGLVLNYGLVTDWHFILVPRANPSILLWLSRGLSLPLVWIILLGCLRATESLVPVQETFPNLVLLCHISLLEWTLSLSRVAWVMIMNYSRSICCSFKNLIDESWMCVIRPGFLLRHLSMFTWICWEFNIIHPLIGWCLCEGWS